MERTIVSFGVVEGQPEPFQPLPSTRVRKTKKGPKKAQLYKQKIVFKKSKNDASFTIETKKILLREHVKNQLVGMSLIKKFNEKF